MTISGMPSTDEATHPVHAGGQTSRLAHASSWTSAARPRGADTVRGKARRPARVTRGSAQRARRTTRPPPVTAEAGRRRRGAGPRHFPGSLVRDEPEHQVVVRPEVVEIVLRDASASRTPTPAGPRAPCGAASRDARQAARCSSDASRRRPTGSGRRRPAPPRRATSSTCRGRMPARRR